MQLHNTKQLFYKNLNDFLSAIITSNNVIKALRVMRVIKKYSNLITAQNVEL
jgi:hypothetical protein